jgi:hypothetical protein
MGFYSGPTVVNDSLVFCFDAGSDKCTDADDAVASMRDIAPIAHSSRTDRGITGTGNTGNFSFPTNMGASKVIDLSISDRNAADDADDYDNRLVLDDDLSLGDEVAWSFEFWGKLHSDCINTYHSMGGRGATNPWIIQHKSGSASWTLRFRENDATYRTSATQTDDARDWHQMVFTVATNRTMKMYINGALISTFTLNNSTVTINRIMAGYESGTSRYGYEGVMLCCRAYTKELSAAEVLQNFNATRGRVGI